MSGIFAYIGREEPKKILLEGIKQLQHRGGEVNGIAIKIKDGFSTAKIVGDEKRLAEESKRIALGGCCGIAETSKQNRAVGAASTVPSTNNLYCAACDGSITNFRALKRWSREPFAVSTDDDLLLASLCIMNCENKIELANKTAASFSSAPSFAFISSSESAVYARAGICPLFVGIGENGMLLSSELAALFPVCEKYAVLENGETVKLLIEKAAFFDEKGRKLKKAFKPMPDLVHFVNNHSIADELGCCAMVAREVYSSFVKSGVLDFGSLKLTHRSVEKLSRIILVGEGSSYAAALYAKSVFEAVTDIPSYACTSGEFMISHGVIDKNTLLIAVSERGETKNTLSCVQRAKAVEARTIAVTGSGMSALALACGKSVATGCAFTGGVSFCSFVSNALALALLALCIGERDYVVSELYMSVSLKMAELLSGKIAAAVKDNTSFTNALKLLGGAENIFVCGAEADYAAAVETAHKMRLVSGENASAVRLSELVNYSRELLCRSAVIAFVTNKDRAPSCDVYLSRMKALGARIILLTTESIEDETDCFDTAIAINDTMSIFNPLACVAAGYKLSLLLSESQRSEEEQAS